MFDILVIGSINADLVFTTDKRPDLGETVMGKDFKLIPGGKGANQAVAAARLGKNVGFLGCVGKDVNGKMLRENLEKNRVNTQYINIIDQVPSGVANIIVSQRDNSIIVVPGANYSISEDMIDENINIIKNSKLILLQNEIPLKVVKHVINVAYEHKVKLILNPAPASKLNDNIISKVDYLTPNEHECKIIFNNTSLEKALEEYPNKLIVTRGDKGVLYHNGKEIVNIPAYKVKVVDTTGAGDTFNGAFAAALIDGYSIYDSISYANKAAALSITRFGAQAGMPYKEDLEKNLAANKDK